jgi:hypothetical protein
VFLFLPGWYLKISFAVVIHHFFPARFLVTPFTLFVKPMLLVFTPCSLLLSVCSFCLPLRFLHFGPCRFVSCRRRLGMLGGCFLAAPHFRGEHSPGRSRMQNGHRMI